jgi:hypothetical protein
VAIRNGRPDKGLSFWACATLSLGQTVVQWAYITRAIADRSWLWVFKESVVYVSFGIGQARAETG